MNPGPPFRVANDISDAHWFAGIARAVLEIQLLGDIVRTVELFDHAVTDTKVCVGPSKKLESNK